MVFAKGENLEKRHLVKVRQTTSVQSRNCGKWVKCPK